QRGDAADREQRSLRELRRVNGGILTLCQQFALVTAAIFVGSAGAFHAGRSLLGLAATVVYLWAMNERPRMIEPQNPEILLERRGAAGVVALNRPKALNALTRDMIRRLRAALDGWRNDPAVTRVVIIADGGRAFSAGGDLREIYDHGRAGRQAEALAFFREE